MRRLLLLIPFLLILAACGGGEPEDDLASLDDSGNSDTFAAHLDRLENSCPNDSRSDIAQYLENGYNHLNDEGYNVTAEELTAEMVNQFGGVEWHEDDCVNAVALTMTVFAD